MKLREFDLNLLVAFDCLMRERSVSKAAQALYLSQSAVSHSLNRLRDKLGDPLLVATKGGMLPTARALELEQPIREWLTAIEQQLAEKTFDAKTSRVQFVLASSDYVEYAFLPSLVERLSLSAPQTDLMLKYIEPGNIDQALARGEIDAAVRLFSTENRRDIVSEKIAVEEPVVLMKKEHPRLSGFHLDLQQYLSEPHLVINSMELSREVEVILTEQKLQRRIQLQVPSFLSAPIILAESDMLATVPTYIARRFIQGERLKIASLPLQVGYFPVMLSWHKFKDLDPAQQWFRQQLVAVGQELTAQRQVEGRPDRA